MIIFNKRESNHHPFTFNSISTAESPTLNNIAQVTIDQKLNWTVATRPGQRLPKVCPQSTQVRTVMEYSVLAWMSAALIILKKLDIIQE